MIRAWLRRWLGIEQQEMEILALRHRLDATALALAEARPRGIVGEGQGTAAQAAPPPPRAPRQFTHEVRQ